MGGGGRKTELGLDKNTGNANDGLLLVINNLAVYTGGTSTQCNAMHSPLEARQDRQNSRKRLNCHGILRLHIPCVRYIMCYLTPLLACSQNVLFQIFNPPILKALARY